jgi:hypothetical protein
MRLRVIAIAVLAAAVSGTGVSPADALETQAGRQVLEMETIPSIPGVVVKFAGHRWITDKRGRVTVRIGTLAPSPTRRGTRPLSLEGTFRRAARVQGTVLPDGGIVRLERFYRTRLAMKVYYKVRPRFVGIDGLPIDSRQVESYTLKSRHGIVLTHKGDETALLQASRVVPYTGELLSKDIEWSVERVMIDGTNVVNRAQQRFFPNKAKGGALPVKLLFYPARFTSKDAIFGFHVGSAVVLRYPNGKVRRHEFGRGGEVKLPRLPRGEYNVKVDGWGMSPERPVALSRSQDVDLKVISYLDIFLVGLLLAAVALGLVILPRAHFRRALGQLWAARRGRIESS